MRSLVSSVVLFALCGSADVRVPYFSGPGGITPPGGNQGTPGSQLTDPMGNVTRSPDLVHDEPRFTLAMLVKL